MTALREINMHYKQIYPQHTIKVAIKKTSIFYLVMGNMETKSWENERVTQLAGSFFFSPRQMINRVTQYYFV